MDLFYWRNDAETMAASFNTFPISLETHRKWFEESLADTNRTLYIGEDDGRQKIGVVRFDKLNPQAVEVNINLAPSMRGKSFGADMILEGCEKYTQESGFNGLFLAKIKAGNIASVKTFKKAGFFDLFSYMDPAQGEVLALGRIIQQK